MKPLHATISRASFAAVLGSFMTLNKGDTQRVMMLASPTQHRRAQGLSHTTQSIAARVQGELLGPGDITIDSLADIDYAKPGQLTFIGAATYASKWAHCQASAALVSKGIGVKPTPEQAVIVVDDADLAMITVLHDYAPATPKPTPGVHPSAVIDPSAKIGAGCQIGPYCVVGAGAQIGDDTTLHAGAQVMDNARVGSGCEFWPNVVVRDRCEVGDRCILHPGAVIGADGFGFRVDHTAAPTPVLRKVPQIGTVQIGNDCEIGANSTIDRAKFAATTLGNYCKLDNLVQIGHNCLLGDMVVISGCVGVGGSCTIGEGTLIGGKAMLKDHLRIGRGCSIAGGAAVVKDMPDGAAWAGYPAGPVKERLREEIALRKLPALMKQARQFLP